jgi:hypothetical protein
VNIDKSVVQISDRFLMVFFMFNPPFHSRRIPPSLVGEIDDQILSDFPSLVGCQAIISRRKAALKAAKIPYIGHSAR